MENFISVTSSVIFALVGIVIFAGILLRFIKYIFSKEKSACAILENKQITSREIIRKSDIPKTKTEYILTFTLENTLKKLHFSVSETTYRSLCIKDKGILYYKGNVFLDFDTKGRSK